MRRAKASSQAWEQIRELKPDVALLQEVSSIPDDIASYYNVLSTLVARKKGGKQTFSNVTLSQLPLEAGPLLTSELIWVNTARDYFDGNIQTSRIILSNDMPLDLINVYSPAWPVPPEVIGDADINVIRLVNNPKLWCTEILWKVLLDSWKDPSKPLVVAGDFNSSETFDYFWGGKPRGNLEVMERMNELGLFEALRSQHGRLTPTFRSPRNGSVVHQMDHFYCSSFVMKRIKDAKVSDPDIIFGQRLSDHLPITIEMEL